jgi:hypothetical protein
VAEVDLFPDQAARAQLEAEIKCVEREVKLRERVYPRWIQGGRMTQTLADREVDLMKAVLARLRGLL